MRTNRMKKRYLAWLLAAAAVIGGLRAPEEVRAESAWYEDLEVSAPSVTVESGSADYSGYLALEREEVPAVRSINGLKRASLLPSAYMNDIDVVTATFPSTRNQGSYETCWAFSAVGLAEFDMIVDNQTADRSVDYSELQTAYFTYNQMEDPLGGTYGDTFQIRAYGKNYLTLGGNQFSAARALLQWMGLGNETALPYTSASAYQRLTAADAYAGNEVHLQNVYCINIHENPELVKQEIMNHGAAGIGYYAAETAAEAWLYQSAGYYQGSLVPAYYCSRRLTANHAVNIIGWDDNFPASAFADTPSGDGAWLVRNSWSTENGYDVSSGGSYFWLSYYDATLEDAAYIYDFEAADNYDYNYQYDGGVICYPSYQSSGFDAVANVFQVKGEDNESLEAVSLSLMYAANVPYTIKVYVNLKNGTRPRSGCLAATVKGTTSYAGVYTIPLGKSVPLAKGTKYSVVVELGTSDNWVDVEYAYSDYICSTTAYMEPGQSFALCNGAWEDMEDLNGYPCYTGNWCIKAYTSSLPGEKVAQVSTLKKKTVTKNSITLKWSKVSGASGYEIYRATTKNGVYKKIATVSSGSKTTYRNTGLAKNKTYYYRVRAYRTNSVTEDGTAAETTTVGKLSSTAAIKTKKK